ncbi:battenin isoform X2 [Ischnura elegans]|uniref:battenin isoform X2 n=1 Tax=Ischnura elegans TaxID=197161 RepID=UPI001ED8AE74|nr:battenin isoform X2 [Ischnura elegans]
MWSLTDLEMDSNGSPESSPEPGSPLSVEPLESEARTEKRARLWRNLTGFWILGLCNNYGYVVMLSAAHDILSAQGAAGDCYGEVSNSTTPNERGCNLVSTGAILLADIIPSVIVKFIAPFLPFCVYIRIGISVLLQAGGFVLVALSSCEGAIIGVICVSFAAGLGEATFLAYTTYFKEKVISTWSSGTGGAGVIGAVSYAGLLAAGLSSSTTLLIMVVIPALEAVVFMFLLKHPGKLGVCNAPTEEELRSMMKNVSTEPDDPMTSVKLTLREKFKIIPGLMKYMIPLVLVYFFEYFINQGIYELIYFPDISHWLDRQSQYRWLQVDYQVGVFLSRSSLHLFQFKWLWLLAFLQGVNVIFFTLEAVYYFTPSIWIIFALVLWEGLLGGGSYVNTFHRVSQEAPPDRKEFSVGVVCMSDSFGIAFAGILSIPAHNALCSLPLEM